MAFSTQNVRTTVFGNLRVTYGQWTGSLGDAPGTISIAGGQIWGLPSFATNLATGPQQVVATPSFTGTAGVLTLTIPNQNAVTAGTFYVLSS